MNHYYMVISHRKTKEVMVVLKCHRKHEPIDVLKNYAEWNDTPFIDLLYRVIICADYNDILQNKDILHNVP